MQKPIVFISHIVAEKELAIAFKELIEKNFLNMIEVFVSSDEHSIGMGQRWLDNITQALKSCSIEIILCSPKSIERPWINFEAGAGWIRDIPVIPLCHSGMDPSKLPLPLNLLQGANAKEVSGLKLIFPVIAQAIGASIPNIDFGDFISKVAELEQRYTYWNVVNEYFKELNRFHPEIIQALKQGKTISLELTETDIGKLESIIAPLNDRDILSFQRHGGVKMTTNGTFYQCSLVPLGKLKATLNDKNFKL